MIDKLCSCSEKILVPMLIILTAIVFCSWLFGYYMNGLYGYKFDLASCWVGCSALGTGVFKYLIDSWLNSARGKKPMEENK